MAKEVMVAPWMSTALRLWPSTITKMKRIAESPTSQEPSEMQMSFMECPRAEGAK